ncbi:MAG: Uma2 family endonuclease [Gemmataceae bacterium]|nr:Uma2 family endonuclease [Gemmataceae bacterium]
MARMKSVEPEIIHYPDSDGQPLADNSVQRRHIVAVHGNLEDIYTDEDEVCIQIDMLWYPVKGHPEICVAPDVLVAFGRPRGDRGSYKQWEEGDHPPDVVFEVLSPNNTKREMEAKLLFYQTHKAKEYYLIDPYTPTVSGWLRKRGKLQPVPRMDGFVSPLLKIRFDLSTGDIVIYRPDGTIFLTFEEMARQKRIACERADDAEAKAERAQEEAERAQEEAERAQEEAERAQEEAERERAEAASAKALAARLAAKLRALGVDPEAA